MKHMKVKNQPIGCYLKTVFLTKSVVHKREREREREREPMFFFRNLFYFNGIVEECV